jgi:hypothetical protein
MLYYIQLSLSTALTSPISSPLLSIRAKTSLESSILLLGSSAYAAAIAAISAAARAFAASTSGIPNKGCSSPSTLLISLLLNISLRGGLNEY